jgi:GT2 family glycosyltransferase
MKGAGMIEPSDVTVIIPAYNHCPLLERSVDRLLTQTALPGEVIVVHSGSDDPTPRLDGKSPIVRVIHRDERMRAGAARNIGSDFAKGAWLAFLDADVLADEDWLEHLLAAARAKPKRLIAGSIDYLTTGGYWGLCLWTIEFGGVHPFLPDYETQGIASANLMLPAAALKEVSGFPSDFPTAEDTIVGAKLQQIGYERWFCAAARTRHMNLPGFAHFASHLFRLGRLSAICRRVVPLQGQIAVKFWPLAFGLFISKFVATLYRALRWGRGRRSLFLGLAPGILVGAVIWNFGVIKGLGEAIPKNLDREPELEKIPDLRRNSAETSI